MTGRFEKKACLSYEYNNDAAWNGNHEWGPDPEIKAGVGKRTGGFVSAVAGRMQYAA